MTLADIVRMLDTARQYSYEAARNAGTPEVRATRERITDDLDNAAALVRHAIHTEATL